eukprot:comp22081_c1_seq1/m.32186 comp22081_c1_seq1/g.32186  ORF comp22081_c1_seq1/g.32186 comp22081_c1_seq1/m.32186 type:complete len:404 (-) comp22081_c1_seq1:107-1318(-)
MPLRPKGLITWGLLAGVAYLVYSRLTRKKSRGKAPESYAGERDRLLTNTDDVYVLYGLSESAFTRKVEVALRWYGLKYEYKTYSLSLRSTVGVRAGTHQLPVVVTPENWVLSDSSCILQMLDGRCTLRMYPDGPLGVLVHCVEEWLDEWMVRYYMHYRFNYDEDAKYSANIAANEMADTFLTRVFKFLIARQVITFGKAAVYMQGLTKTEDQKVAEEELKFLLTKLEEQLHLTKFALGDRPCAVDAMLIGYLRASLLDSPTVSTVTRCFPKVVEYGLRADTPGYWDGGSGKLAPFPQSTPFATYVLGQLSGAYGKYLRENAQALKSGNKSITITVNGQDTTFRARCYPERSRRMIQAHVRHVIETAEFAEREKLKEWLGSSGLSDIFGPPTDSDWGVWETIHH